MSLASEEHDGPENPFFRRFAEWVLRLRWLSLGLSLVLTGLAIAHAGRHLQVDTSAESLLTARSQVVQAIVKLWDDFGHDKLLLVQAEGDVFSLPYLTKLRALHEEIAAIQMDLPSLGESPADRLRATGADLPPSARVEAAVDSGFAEEWGSVGGGSVFERVTSLINARDIHASEGAIDVRGLLDDPPTADALPALKERVLKDESLVGTIVGKDGRHSLIVARTAFMSPEDGRLLTNAVRDLLKKYDADDFRLIVTGVPAIEGDLALLTVEDAGLVFGAALLLIIGLLAFLFRGVFGVLGPVLVILQTVAWMFGAMSIAGAPVTPASNLLATLMLCVGIGESIHIQAVYREARRRGVATERAIVQTLAHTGAPVVFTALTTMLGLLSFVSSDIAPVRDMGIYGALGVGFSLVLSIVFLPAFLALHGRSFVQKEATQAAPREDWIDRLIARADRIAGRESPARRTRTLVGAALVAVLCCAGIARILPYHDPLSWFPESMGYQRDVLDVDEHIGGSTTVSVLLTPKGSATVADRDLLLALERFEEHLLAFREPDTNAQVVSGVTSVLDLVRETNRALHGGDPTYYAIPATQEEVRDVFTMLEATAGDELKDVVTVDRKRALVTVRVRWREAGEYRALARYVEEGASQYLSGYEVELTGTVFAMLEVVSALIDGLVESGFWSVLTVTLLLVFMLRDIKLGLLAMIPNVLPILAVLGMMGWLGIPLNLSNMMIAAIVLSFAVDDTVHFMHQFRAHYLHAGNVERAVRHAFDHSGRAAVGTSLVVGGGFLVCLVAKLEIWRNFGVLIALAVVLALLAELLLSPALLRAAFRDRAARDLTVPSTDPTQPSSSPA